MDMNEVKVILVLLVKEVYLEIIKYERKNNFS